MKTGNIVAILIVAVAGAIVFWKREWLKERFGIKAAVKKADAAEPKADSPAPSAGKSAFSECEGFPLKFGCRGQKVRVLQLALNKNFNSGIDVDGDFGTETEKALVKAGFGKELEMSEVVKVMV